MSSDRIVLAYATVSPLTKADSNYLRIYHNEFTDTHYLLYCVNVQIFYTVRHTLQAAECIVWGHHNKDTKNENVSVNININSVKPPDFSLP